MIVLILGLFLFLGTHSVRMVAPGLRERVMAHGGERAWMLPYTVISILGLVLIVWGYGLARQEPIILYAPPTGLRHLALLLMLPVFPLVAAAYAPGHIRAALGHPMLIATILWGGAHLTANGTLADLVLFGGLAGWAAVDWASSVRHPRKPAAVRMPSIRADVVAVLAGLAVYGLFLAGLHRMLFGVSPV
ncbi:NnrU family protein [Chelativorans sp. M5D2P16]|uniref:NnrU family protein n=1 Tax=Chelativorans sp. M5D2P16 TaxID=3095678 RepID=UPI002AC9F30C|nr:NnrU family protein [Chelativorans sp. M5D2P16]MDZ5698877.1 NnrU family protein [Chelativorans sp. M5D2P16]